MCVAAFEHQWFKSFDDTSNCPCPRLLVNFRNKIIFYGEELLAPRPTPKLEGHPLSAVRDCLFNIFAATPPPPATVVFKISMSVAGVLYKQAFSYHHNNESLYDVS
jgi:hypothetical protein